MVSQSDVGWERVPNRRGSYRKSASNNVSSSVWTMSSGVCGGWSDNFMWCCCSKNINTSYHTHAHVSSLIWTQHTVQSRSAGTHRYKLLTSWVKFNQCCFSHTGPNAWNTLSYEIQDLTDLGTFKQKPKTFFFEHALTAQWRFSRCWSLRSKHWTVSCIFT